MTKNQDAKVRRVQEFSIVSLFSMMAHLESQVGARCKIDAPED